MAQKKQNDLECPGDDISCISKADGPIGDHNGEGDRKNGEPSECSRKQVESSSVRVAMATCSFGGQMPGIPNRARSVKSDIDLDDGHQATEAVQFSDKKEHSEKSSALLEISSAQKRLEELLATYTKCSDGAEHIYCMRIKLKKAPGWDWMCKECMAKEETQKEIKGVIECPISDKDIRRFDANLRLFPWVAVYTGNETKLGMSRGIPEPKLTAVDAMIDKLTGAIFVFQIVVVIVLGIAGNVWKDIEAVKQWYVLHSKEGIFGSCKELIATFIDWDNQVIDQETSTPSYATNTVISEDLRQVEYTLTDKTGTLTENRMIFRRCCIRGIFYGNESGDALKDVELLNAVSSGPPYDIRFLTTMAICNTVIPVKSKTGAISFEAQSQDEDALVQATACLHMVFVNKDTNTLEINFNASIIQYEVLDTLEFTSDRKRMEWSQAEVCQRLEHDLEILGVTAIEDHLQDGISETIELELQMICIPPLTIYRYASAHIDGIATKYSEIVETKVIQEKMANCNESLLKISEMRGERNNKGLMKRLYPGSSELEVMCDVVRDLQSERLHTWPEYRG
ncbi:hypothetical protein AAG906_015241 [Vitis piasezkii]